MFRYQAADYVPMEAFKETTRPKQDGNPDINDHVALFVDKPSILMPLAIPFLMRSQAPFGAHRRPKNIRRAPPMLEFGGWEIAKLCSRSW